MQRGVGVWAISIAGWALSVVACTSSNGSASSNTSSNIQQCAWPEALSDGGPGACAVARAYVSCTLPSGDGCGCLSADPKSCPACGPSTGAKCTSHCAAAEYAVSCGGPPRPDNVVYQELPSSCRSVGGTPGGNVYGCCPCE